MNKIKLLIFLVFISALSLKAEEEYKSIIAVQPDQILYASSSGSLNLLSDLPDKPLKWCPEKDIFESLKKNNLLWMRIRLPENILNDMKRPMIFFTLYTEAFKVFQGNTLIYEYTPWIDKENFRYYNYHIIHLRKELPENCCIYIASECSHPLNSASVIKSSFGEEDDIFKDLLREQASTTSSIITNLIFGILSIFAGLFSFAAFFRRFELKEYLLLIFGLFSITGGIRSINSYSFAAIINMTQMTSMLIFFISIFILPVLILAFIDLLLGGNTQLKKLWLFNLVFLLVPMAWYFMLIKFRQSEYIHIASLAIDFIIFPFLIPKESFKQKTNKRFLIIVFMIFYIYIINDILLNSNILSWEISLFIWSTILVLFAYGFIISRHLQETRSRINDFSQEIDKKTEEVNELKKKNLESQFEALKGQLTPHFLFNTLNTLASVIEDNPKLAVEFVEEFSNVYRYVLQCKDRNLIELESEIEFIKSYTFLLLKRHQDNFNISVEVGKEFYSFGIPPLTLQILVENVIKHNIISKKKPLSIYITIESENGGIYLIVRNNIQLKAVEKDSYKVGLNNIINRYKFFTSQQVRILDDGNEYSVKVPLISSKDI